LKADRLRSADGNITKKRCWRSNRNDALRMASDGQLTDLHRSMPARDRVDDEFTWQVSPAAQAGDLAGGIPRLSVLAK
jgi:hypothetical protein